MLLPAGQHWLGVKDGDHRARAIARRGYAWHEYKDNRPHLLFAGPGEKMVLLTEGCNAVWVWRKFIDDSGQTGVNCALFRNESNVRSSLLIIEACELAARRWPGERQYTYVDADKVESHKFGKLKPGWCYLKAGWAFVRGSDGKPLLTGSGKHILEYWPGRENK